MDRTFKVQTRNGSEYLFHETDEGISMAMQRSGKDRMKPLIGKEVKLVSVFPWPPVLTVGLLLVGDGLSDTGMLHTSRVIDSEVKFATITLPASDA